MMDAQLLFGLIALPPKKHIFNELYIPTLLDYLLTVRPEPVEGSCLVGQAHHERDDFSKCNKVGLLYRLFILMYLTVPVLPQILLPY